MSERIEPEHVEKDPAEVKDRCDHLVAELKELLARYEKPDRPIDLAICEILRLEKLGMIREKF